MFPLDIRLTAMIEHAIQRIHRRAQDIAVKNLRVLVVLQPDPDRV